MMEITSVLGIQIVDADLLDTKYLANENQFKKHIRALCRESESEKRDEIRMPEMMNLLHKWTEVSVLFEIETGDGSYVLVSHRSQGKVIEILANPDCNRFKEPQTMEQTLLPSKQNENCYCAWQLDVRPDYSGSDSSSDC